MEWMERLNQSVDYLEANLGGELRLEEAAHIACCSAYHYQRMFSYIAGVPLAEYIRRRRMTAAAFELQSTEVKIIDLALKYGYDSPTAFNRAFQSVHGIAPSAARAEGATLRAYPRIRITIAIKGDVEMKYRMEQKAAIRIVGVKERMDVSPEENFMQVPLFWQRTAQSGMFGRIVALMNQPPWGVLGVSTCMNGQELDYYIAVASDQAAPDGMCAYEIAAATWAVFECCGPLPQAMQELQKRIITEWLPTSGYEYADAPDIELYSEGDQQAADYRSEVWLPVTKKVK
jgi:AraC family transcriptional regulator